MMKNESLNYTEFLNILNRSTELLNEDAIPEELYSVDRLELYASDLARELKTSEKPKRGLSLRPELKKSGIKLEASYTALARSIQNKETVSPAAEWFVDNFHIIENQLREIKQNLPDDYYYGLPQLSEGDLKGFPRVYALALAVIAHTDSRLDQIALKRFLIAFQRVSPLKIGELWAIVLTLRIVLVQHLQVLAMRLVSAKENREKADDLADRLLAYALVPKVTEKDLIKMLTKELGNPQNFDRAFIVQLLQRLRDQDPSVWPAVDWIQNQLAALSTSIHKVTQLELRRQASGQVTIGNIIGSMRLISTIDWRKFFEEISLVDKILRADPAGAYANMDFGTRDQYRHAIEIIAKRSRMDELKVADLIIEEAKKGVPNTPEAHVGYHLVGSGRRKFEQLCHYRTPLRDRIQRVFLSHPTLIYLGSTAFLTSILLIPVIAYYQFMAPHFLGVIGFALVALFPASELAVSFFNHYITYSIRPTPLPRMDTENGIPVDAATMVVIPTLFTRESGVTALLENLEIHALANHDPNLTFALLSDFTDAPQESMPTDEGILKVALAGIHALNERYWPDSEPRFFLFHRKRLYNESEGSWIGWERKRGKLLEFNRLLRGATDTTYMIVTADQETLSQIKYIITLDSDTQLPREAAQKLVGTIIHPLNRPQFDPSVGRVTSGYGILQPRISITSESAQATRFAKIYSGNTGIDPYTTAVSDVYQDLFEEGSFTGKGLYVVDAFEQSLHDRVPENSVLSHDLFEGSYARTALVTDVELFDDYPGHYETYLKRQHRWIRGDWQIMPWLFPLVANANGKYVRNDLSIISRWKIFDNLRRSLVPIATLAWLFLAWTILPGTPAYWTALIILMYLFPVYSTVVTGDWTAQKGVSWFDFFMGGVCETKIKIKQILLTIAFLPNQSITQGDAIIRALYRMYISKKKLLEWMAFAQLSPQKKSHLGVKDMVDSGPLLALAILAIILSHRPEALPVAGPFILLWLVNPWIKLWLRKKPSIKKRPLEDQGHQEFRSYARSTWHFFEIFLTDEDNWLAPDNFQEDPKPVVAHRTSPTNIGLQFLASASAYDLGYVGHVEIIEQLEKTFQTLQKLPTMRGHFFNWYDTLTLEPLNPRYISTVDSGNLAGHLLTLKQFLVEVSTTTRTTAKIRQGIEDTFRQLLKEVTRLYELAPVSGSTTIGQLQVILNNLLIQIQSNHYPTDDELHLLVSSLETQLTEAKDILNALALDRESFQESFINAKDWMRTLIKQIKALKNDFTSSKENLREREHALIIQCERLVMRMDFLFLYDQQRKLFVIGYNVNDSRRDNSYYDLLASESRLASFVAIAKGDVTQEHWFRLGRQMTPVKGGRALIAWTATMFEYLMPVLVMKRFEDTLLEQTYKAIVQRQIEYGHQKNVPWGVSEAGFNARDLQMNYQYGPFGVPGLGLKRGLSDEMVVSPYSTMLAALINPAAALENLKRLVSLGAFGRFGFYESLDYTTERLPSKQKFVILKSFMAHHQGMSLVAINNLLNNSIMQTRFHREPLVQATELLLQERVPKLVALSQPRQEEIRSSGFLHSSTDSNPRLYSDVNLSAPRTQLLSNGTYSVMVTSTGAGYSRCGPLAISRWREDATRDHWGQFFYIRNVATSHYWSAAHRPAGKAPQSFGATFSEDKVEFWRKDTQVLTRTEILVSPEDNVELRRITITNESDKEQDFEVTSFMEAVLAKPNDDSAHPAFSNLFVQTEFIPSNGALIGTRRKRSNHENPPFAFHVAATDSKMIGSVQFETDRSRFIGRGREVSNPIVIHENRPLSGTAGSVLDPIFSLRRTLRIGAGESASVMFATGLVHSRQDALNLIDKYHDIQIFKRESEIAWTQAQVQLRHLNISNAKAHTYQKLAGRILYLDNSLRPSTHALSLNTRAQSNLWAYGISGDLPIILTQISDEKDMSLIRELLHAHEYLRLKGLVIDLVILNERAPSYLQSLQDELQRQIRMSGSQALLDKPGGIFLRRTDLIPAEDVTLIRTVARVILSAERGSLEDQLKHRKAMKEMPEILVPKTQSLSTTPTIAVKQKSVGELDFFNGLGGFTPEGREYVITLNEDQWTPAPWINVLANSHDFGCTISESGSGFTWSANSRENRITPWSNDPVSDPSGEIIYLRDEESGEFWSPTPLPIREKEPYIIRHGQGYTKFEHTSHGIEQGLEVFVALNTSVKIYRVRLKNLSSTSRKLSVTSYVEWVLGFQKSATAPYVIPEFDKQTGAILARNPYNNEFASRIAFTDISEPERTYTCDRRAFLGRNGDTKNPASMKRASLSLRSGAGLDPCGSFQTKFELKPGEEKIIHVILGQADSTELARENIIKFRSPEVVEETFQEVLAFWEKTLTAVTIKTPDKAMDTLVNRWLPYQTLSCRIWARSAFYQSGGAFGFRDQLQDTMAMVWSHPEITRAQILTAAARQFKQGDVQHWWHPPTGRGVRTHFSDDLLWLPLVTSYYIKNTGDTKVLDEEIPFIEAQELLPGQEDSYTHPHISEELGSIFEHCARAIDRSLKVGVHGLPLMGSGDWNDGMNRVGHEGKGESVWVAWFLYTTIEHFLPFCDLMKATERAQKYRDHLVHLKKAVEENAWDGDWYRRAYFDDGTPLGSATNEECRIDSISQSWAVLSKAADPQRAGRAMAAVDTHLIHRADGLIKLFSPAFDKTPLDPGYIKGYVPGVRENGGQYTHAAIWTLMAFAELGDGDRAQELYAILNPINHSLSRAGLHKYKVEPYVVAADVYGLYPHVGRGGWTWYTGSASWMYRASIESILGFDRKGDSFNVHPRVPGGWDKFEITFKKDQTTYRVSMVRFESHQESRAEVDGTPFQEEWIPIVNDGQDHAVTLRF